MMTKQDQRKLPEPLYAAAGAGDLAYQQLRKLPERVADLRDRVSELRPAVTEAVREDRLRADLNRLRKVARRNANAVVAGATSVYGDLVARGRRVVRGTRTPAGSPQTALPKPPAKAVSPVKSTPPAKKATRSTQK